MRQKKNKYKKQEHRSFIDWFISVPAKITRSGHQIEIKMYSLSRVSGNTIFIKKLGKSLTGLSKLHKNKERRKIWETTRECMGEVRSHSSNNQVIAGNIPPDVKVNRILLGANSKVNLFTIDEWRRKIYKNKYLIADLN